MHDVSSTTERVIEQMDRPRSLNPKPWVGSCRVLCVRFCWLVWREVYGYVDMMFHRIQLCGFGRVMLAFCLGDDAMYIAASSGLIAKLCQGALTQCRALKHLLYMYFNRGYTNVCMRHLILTHIHTVILLHHIRLLFMQRPYTKPRATCLSVSSPSQQSVAISACPRQSSEP